MKPKLIRFKEELTYKQALKKVPKGYRIIKAWELLKLYDENRKALKDIPRGEYFFTYGNKEYYRTCWLNNFDDDSGFGAVGWGVDNSNCRLRGVVIVKVGEKQ